MSGFAIGYWPDTELVKYCRPVESEADVTELETYWPESNGTLPIPSPAPLTPADILAVASAKLSGLTAEYNAQKNALTNRVSTLQDSIELEMATPEEEAELPVRQAQLKSWKTYGVLLGRVTTLPAGAWPTAPVWPTKPTAGMDLTVSSQAPEQV